MAAQNVVKTLKVKVSAEGQREVIRDLGALRTEAAGAAAATEKLTVTQENGRRVIDRTAGMMRKLSSETDRLQRSIDPAYRDTLKLSNAQQLLDRSVSNGLRTQSQANQILTALAQKHSAAAQAADILREAQRGADAANDNFRAGIVQSDAALDRFRRSMGLTDDRMERMQTGFVGMAATLGRYRMALAGAVGAVGFGGGFAISGIIGTAAEFQKLEASLKTVTGSAANAQAAMSFIRDFAAETPFDIQQVTESFIRLKSLGLDPSRAALESYGNTASAMGKPVMQVVEAIADAVTGEFERLKEFGIRASKDGEQISFTFQGITTTIGNSAKEIEAYLRGIGEVNFAGAMVEQMETLPGALSNLSDAVATFQDQIGRGGLADAVEDSARSMATFLAENENLARFIGSEMGHAIRDLNGVVSDIGTAAAWAAAEVQAFGRDIEAAFGAAASVANSFATAITGFFNQITGASAAAARILPDGWDEAVREIHDKIAGGVQNIVRTLAQIPAAGHAARRAIFGEDFAEAFAEEQQYFIDRINGIGAAAGDLVGFHVTLDEVVISSRDAANATADLRSNVETMAPAAAAAGAAIDAGITKPSKEAEKALRDAEAARRALFSEADAAIGQFFPFEAATAEAERLMAIVDDMGNGLTDLQRNALRLKADQGFIDLSKAAESATGKVTELRDTSVQASEDIGQAFASNVGSTILDIFTDAGSGADGFFSRVVSGFASIGKQAAEIGKNKLMETLFGKAAGYTTGAQAPGQRSVFPAGVSQAAGVSMSFSVPTPTAAMRQTSRQLAETVTESVSGNLLQSVLGAGKSREHISGLNTEFANSLTAMFAAAPASVQAVTKINSGFRSVARQAQLFDAAVAKYGSETAARRWVAPPGRSNHNGGMAADLGFGTGAARDWFHQNAGSYGLKFPMSHEPWHIEAGSTRGGSSTTTARALRQATSEGYLDAARRISTGAVPNMGGAASYGPQMSNQAGAALANGWSGFGPEEGGGLFGPRGQAGLGLLGAGAGAFFNGAQSGNPISGALGGAMSGLGAASSIATLLPSLAGVAGPVGMAVGAAIGLAGSPRGGRKTRAAEHFKMVRRFDSDRS